MQWYWDMEGGGDTRRYQVIFKDGQASQSCKIVKFYSRNVIFSDQQSNQVIILTINWEGKHPTRNRLKIYVPDQCWQKKQLRNSLSIPSANRGPGCWMSVHMQPAVQIHPGKIIIRHLFRISGSVTWRCPSWHVSWFCRAIFIYISTHGNSSNNKCIFFF